MVKATKYALSNLIDFSRCLDSASQGGENTLRQRKNFSG
jgi:hypothetical protein